MPGCCEWCSTHFRRPARWAVGVLEIGVAVAIVCIVYFQLVDYSYIDVHGDFVNYQCLLGHDSQGHDLCTYAYATSGISMVLSVYLMFSVCWTCTCWMYVELWIDWLLVILGSLLWVVFGIVISNYNTTTDKTDAVTSTQQWRNAVTVLGWVAALFFICDTLGCSMRLCYKVCGCCGGKEAAEAARAAEAKKKEEESRKAEEAARANMPPPVQGIETQGPGALPVATKPADVHVDIGSVNDPAPPKTKSFFGFKN